MEKLRLTGKIHSGCVDFSNKTPSMVTFIVNEKLELWNAQTAFENMKLTIDVMPYRGSKTPAANSYVWALICKIADVINAAKDEVYIKMLKRYGKSELINLLPNVPIAEYAKYYEEAGECFFDGTKYKSFFVYHGVSEYNTREMAKFIDGVVSEAQELNIPTETPEELDRIKSLWKE